MINGNTTEFIDKLWSGEELIYMYNGKKYFSQGYMADTGENVFLNYKCGNQKKKLYGALLENPIKIVTRSLLQNHFLKEKHFGM